MISKMKEKAPLYAFNTPGMEAKEKEQRKRILMKTAKECEAPGLLAAEQPFDIEQNSAFQRW